MLLGREKFMPFITISRGFNCDLDYSFWFMCPEVSWAFLGLLQLGIHWVVTNGIVAKPNKECGT